MSLPTHAEAAMKDLIRTALPEHYTDLQLVSRVQTHCRDVHPGGHLLDQTIACLCRIASLSLNCHLGLITPDTLNKLLTHFDLPPIPAQPPQPAAGNGALKNGKNSERGT